MKLSQQRVYRYTRNTVNKTWKYARDSSLTQRSRYSHHSACKWCNFKWISRNYCRDTDVILVMIYHLGNLDADMWMASGTARQSKCYSTCQTTRALWQSVGNSILGIHALTGCDMTSSYTGLKKKTKLYHNYPDLFSDLGQTENLEKVEEFVCLLYDAASAHTSLNAIRNSSFSQGTERIGDAATNYEFPPPPVAHCKSRLPDKSKAKCNCS